MTSYALGIAFNWEFDVDFIAGLERECARRGVTTYRVDPQNLEDTLSLLLTNTIGFDLLYDRASDTDEAFHPLVDLLNRRSVPSLNPHALVAHASDKATMHLELITHGLHVPYTIIISPYAKKKEVELNLSELERLGRPFIIKPANTTGGGIGVVLGAETLKDVIESRQHHKNDKYLLQERIEPKRIEGRRAWFRGFYCMGETILCWWDDITHTYSEIAENGVETYLLEDLRHAVRRIQEVCHLDFFSTEIAVTPEDTLVVVDYVNEVCDMRLQSKYADGVPDNVVTRIQACIAQEVSRRLESRDHPKEM